MVTDAEAIKRAYDSPIDPYLVVFPSSPQAAGSVKPPTLSADLESPALKKDSAKKNAKIKRKSKKKSKKYIDPSAQAVMGKNDDPAVTKNPGSHKAGLSGVGMEEYLYIEREVTKYEPSLLIDDTADPLHNRSGADIDQFKQSFNSPPPKTSKTPKTSKAPKASKVTKVTKVTKATKVTKVTKATKAALREKEHMQTMDEEIDDWIEDSKKRLIREMDDAWTDIEIFDAYF